MTAGTTHGRSCTGCRRVLADETLRHVVVRDGGVPVACASLFSADGHAFVTNVGTVPDARGRGLGTRATLAVLDIAVRQGSPTASLTASRMGRGVYARIGFQEDALLRRRISLGIGRAALGARRCGAHLAGSARASAAAPDLAGLTRPASAGARDG